MALLGDFTITSMRIITRDGYEFDLPIQTEIFDAREAEAYINLSIKISHITQRLSKVQPAPPSFADPLEADSWLDHHPAAT